MNVYWCERDENVHAARFSTMSTIDVAASS